MKKLTKKTRYTTDGQVATIYARPKFGPQSWRILGTCHIATIPLMQKDGIRAHLGLISLKQQRANPQS